MEKSLKVFIAKVCYDDQSKTQPTILSGNFLNKYFLLTTPATFLFVLWHEYTLQYCGSQWDKQLNGIEFHKQFNDAIRTSLTSPYDNTAFLYVCHKVISYYDSCLLLYKKGTIFVNFNLATAELYCTSKGGTLFPRTNVAWTKIPLRGVTLSLFCECSLQGYPYRFWHGGDLPPP